MSDPPETRRIVVRVGDKVRVARPAFVVRVGYPKCVADYVPDANKALAAAVEPAFPLSRFDGESSRDRALWRTRRSSHFHDRAVHAFARWMAEVDGFGGRERTVHSVEIPELAGAESVVHRVRTAMTGTYFPPSGGGGYNSWTGDYDDYDPGGLADQKAHRIAELWLPFHRALAEILPQSRKPYALTLSKLECEVEVEDLEIVERKLTLLEQCGLKPLPLD